MQQDLSGLATRAKQIYKCVTKGDHEESMSGLRLKFTRLYSKDVMNAKNNNG